MFKNRQIVPQLASAVRGALDEFARIPDIPIPESYRSRLASTASTISSANVRPTQISTRKAFTYFDKNHDGKLSIKEFKSVMRELGYKNNDKRSIKQMFAEATRKGNGHTITYDEFARVLQKTKDLNCLSTSKMQYDIETLFNYYDLDKNGYIEPKELRKVMKRLIGEKLSKRDIEEMIKVADRNGDGILDKTEFALLCSAF
jgi:Ca2+-binding EF-hand superfamily protein